MTQKGDDSTYVKCANCGEVSIKRNAQQYHLMAYAKIVTPYGDEYICEKCWRKSILRLGANGALDYWQKRIEMKRD